MNEGLARVSETSLRTPLPEGPHPVPHDVARTSPTHAVVLSHAVSHPRWSRRTSDKPHRVR